MTYLVDRKAVQINDKSELHFLHTRARQKNTMATTENINQ